MTSRWFHGYRVGQRVQAQLYMPAGSVWVDAVVLRKNKKGFPVVRGGNLEWPVDLKSRIRPVRTVPEVPAVEPPIEDCDDPRYQDYLDAKREDLLR